MVKIAKTTAGKNVWPLIPSTVAWLIVAKVKLNANPAYAHSFTRAGTRGITSANTPKILKTTNAFPKYSG